jgi:hypothetical protein
LRFRLIVFIAIFFIIVSSISIRNLSVISQLELPPSPGKATRAIPSDPTNPAGGVNESAPRIIMIYNNTGHSGNLDSYSFGKTESMTSLPTSNDKITETIPNQTTTVKQGSKLYFVTKGITLSEAQPDGISATAYTVSGEPVDILKVVDEPNKSNKTISLTMDLNRGQYILLATAIWLPEEQENNQIAGYVSYSYRINVIR